MADQPDDLIPAQAPTPAYAPGGAPWRGAAADAMASQGTMGNILDAMKQGAKDNWGATSFDPKLKEAAGDWKPQGTAAKDFNDYFLKPAASAMTFYLQGIAAPFRGALAGGAGLIAGAEAAGVPHDILGMAVENPLFAGGPGVMGRVMLRPGMPKFTGGVGDKTNLPVAHDLNVIGPERPSISVGTPAEAAAATIKPIIAYHGSPYSFEAFSSEKIGTGEGAQSYGHGLYFAEQPAVAEDYARRLSEPSDTIPPPVMAALKSLDNLGFDRAGQALNVFRDFKAGRDNPKGWDLDQPQDQAAIKTINDYISQPNPEAQHYQVNIHANKEDFLDWDKPLSEQPEKVQKALEQFGIDPANGQTGQDIVEGLQRSQNKISQAENFKDRMRELSDKLREAGIPGIKYLDQGSRKFGDIEKIEENLTLSQKRLDEFQNAKWKDNDAYRSLLKMHQDDVARLQDTLAQAKANPQTHNFVVFNPDDIEITHRNGEPVKPPMPEPTVPALHEPPGLPAGPDAQWEATFNKWVGKLQTSEDAKNLIREAASRNGNFPEARRGDVPVMHAATISEATGIPIDQMDLRGMGRRMKSDEEFRMAGQLLIKTNDDAMEAGRNLRANNTLENQKALVEAMIRHDLALEQVVGRKAEWGRTGNAMQELSSATEDSKALGEFLKNKKGEGWTPEKLNEVARDLAGFNSREQVGRYLTELRKPDFVDKAIWYWTNSLLSGPITHTKYILANAAYLAHDTFVATPLAGLSGLAKQALTSEQIDRVYLGETVAKAYGLVAGLKDAVYAAGKAAQTGLPTPLPAQLAGVGARSPITGLAPIGGPIGTALGVPSRVISGIHSFYNFLGYRAELEAQGYRKAAKAGFSPTSMDFWTEQRGHVEFPDDPSMDAAIQAGARANFVEDLGTSGQALQSFLYRTKLGRFVIPFLKVPANIFNRVQEGIPLLNLLDSRMREALFDKGAVGDMARGRLAAGSAVMGTAAYWALNDNITGQGPIDPKQRSEWLLTHQPHSVKIGNKWVSYDRFGPIGGWLGLAADITAAGQAVDISLRENKMTPTEAQQAQKDLGAGIFRVVVGFGNWFAEAGFQGLFNIVSAMMDPEHSHISSAGAVASTFLPYSSFTSQTASLLDPEVRNTQTFLDGVTNRIPLWRETLKPARDWSGAPRANPQYHSLVRVQDVNADPIDLELQRLDLKPTPPEKQIKGVPLDADRYDEYQTLAGINTRNRLNSLVNSQGWQSIPPGIRSRLFEREIDSARTQAATTMQARYPELINQGVDLRLRNLLGSKSMSGAYQRPASVPTDLIPAPK